MWTNLLAVSPPIFDHELSEVVAICDRFLFLFERVLEHEVFGETCRIAFDCLIQCLGSHRAQTSQVGSYHLLLPENEKNVSLDSL